MFSRHDHEHIEMKEQIDIGSIFIADSPTTASDAM